MSEHAKVVKETYGRTSAPMAPQMFGNAGREHMEKYGNEFDLSPYPCICLLHKQENPLFDL